MVTIYCLGSCFYSISHELLPDIYVWLDIKHALKKWILFVKDLITLVQDHIFLYSVEHMISRFKHF